MSAATFSLLWPDAESPAPAKPDPHLSSDLNIERLVRALCLDYAYYDMVRELLLHLSTDEAVIAYRQAILADLLATPALVEQLEVILQAIIDLEGYLTTPQWTKNPLRQVAWRLSELEHYVETLLRLHSALQSMGASARSAGLRNLRDEVQALTQDETFVQLCEQLPQLLPQIRAVGSITIGINLDAEMRPLSAVLLAAHTEQFVGESLLGRLFKRRKANDDTTNGGGGPLHDARDLDLGSRQDLRVELEDRNSPFMPPLFKDLSNLMDATSRPIAKLLRDYSGITTRFVLSLRPQIAFYLGAVRLIRKLEAAGLPMCPPTYVPLDERRTQLDGLYNINLALQLHRRHENLAAQIVGNDVRFGADGRIFILTGPNQGGKTTYTQAIGLAQVLFQAGLHVPAQQAEMSPVDGLYTHFATEERPEHEAGRLGEEARRLHHIFEQATTHSLVLLNETLASTSATESLYLAQDVVKVLRLLGVRAVFATHLHELAAAADDLNAEAAGLSRVISIVSQVHIEQDERGQVIRRTYKIQPGPPMSKSYALDLAARYGISYAQLVDLLRQRNQIQ